MTDAELEALVAKLLANFYRRRLAKLKEITLATICKKNPYLFRVAGVSKPSEIVESVLQAFLSSSEETVFGTVFFEPLALAASQVKGGHPSGAAGVDIEYTSETTNTAIAIKSSTNSQNASAQGKQNSEFMELRSRLLKTSKNFDAVIASCYGRAVGTPKNRIYRRVAGQAFWEELTGDSEFYLKILDAMKNLPDEHRREYDLERDILAARLEGEFALNFALGGIINWNKLLTYNSGKDASIRLQRARQEPGTDRAILEDISEYELNLASDETLSIDTEADASN